MMQAILDMADKKLQKLEQRRREELPVSELLIGMQCGGSDAFSGITANPSAGYAADMIVRCGGTVMFSEVTEVRDGVQLLAARCVDAHVRDRLAEEMKWYDDYLAAGGVGRDANPTPAIRRAVWPTLWKRPWVPSPRAAPAPSSKCSARPKSPPSTA